VAVTFTLTARHGDDLAEADFAALGTMRRTLLGLLDHGSIVELNTYSGTGETVWSYQEGDEDGSGVMLGLLTVLKAVAPDDWIFGAA
jgi:hypothetical protein